MQMAQVDSAARAQRKTPSICNLQAAICMVQPSLVTVSVFRRHYGKRYTDLPVDQIDSSGLRIDCAETYMRPEQYDLRPGDIVRWRQGERYIEAVISVVNRDDRAVRAELSGAHPLPPDFFPY
jgi:hypothetical protein